MRIHDSIPLHVPLSHDIPHSVSDPILQELNRAFVTIELQFHEAERNIAAYQSLPEGVNSPHLKDWQLRRDVADHALLLLETAIGMGDPIFLSIIPSSSRYHLKHGENRVSRSIESGDAQATR